VEGQRETNTAVLIRGASEDRQLWHHTVANFVNYGATTLSATVGYVS